MGKKHKRFWKELLTNLAHLAVLVGIVAYCTDWGKELGISLTEKKYEIATNKLLIRVDSLQSLVLADSLGKRNWINSHTTGLVFSVVEPDLPLVTITNVTKRPCQIGYTDGCWVTNLNAYPKDSVVVQIKCRNYSELDLLNGRVGFRVDQSKSGKSLSIIGGVRQGNTILAEGASTIYIHNYRGYRILPRSRVYDAMDEPPRWYDIPKGYNFNYSHNSAAIPINALVNSNYVIQFWIVFN